MQAAEAVVVADGSVVLSEDDESALMTRVYGGPAIPEGKPSASEKLLIEYMS
jgi:hypothetical protein